MAKKSYSSYKNIDGQIYFLWGIRPTKTSAEKLREKLKKEYESIRIFKFGSKYLLYAKRFLRKVSYIT